MPVLERPTRGEIDSAVERALKARADSDRASISFPDLEREILKEYREKKVVHPILVRQAAWRLINRNRARLLPSFDIELTNR